MFCFRPFVFFLLCCRKDTQTLSSFQKNSSRPEQNLWIFFQCLRPPPPRPGPRPPGPGWGGGGRKNCRPPAVRVRPSASRFSAPVGSIASRRMYRLCGNRAINLMLVGGALYVLRFAALVFMDRTLKKGVAHHRVWRRRTDGRQFLRPPPPRPGPGGRGPGRGGGGRKN